MNGHSEEIRNREIHNETENGIMVGPCWGQGGWGHGGPIKGGGFLSEMMKMF